MVKIVYVQEKLNTKYRKTLVQDSDCFVNANTHFYIYDFVFAHTWYMEQMSTIYLDGVNFNTAR